MTSWREDLLRHFENGKDLVIFEGKDDLLRKADYYLEHEEERRKIAENGYCKVKAFHTYDHRLREMFDVLKEHKIILS
jgi:spore maturation protein CgeB